MTQAAKAQVDEVLYVPAALALRQRPGVPRDPQHLRHRYRTAEQPSGSCSPDWPAIAVQPAITIRLLWRWPPARSWSARYAASGFMPLQQKNWPLTARGACRTCGGTGMVQKVDRSSLVPDESLTIDQGAVAPWNSLMWSLMTDVCRAMGVRTDVPFRELTEKEKAIVYDGPAQKKSISSTVRKTRNRLQNWISLILTPSIR